MIHTYELATLDPTQRSRLLRRAEVAIDELIEYVRPIVHAVRDRGDEALIECMERTYSISSSMATSARRRRRERWVGSRVDSS